MEPAQQLYHQALHSNNPPAPPLAEKYKMAGRRVGASLMAQTTKNLPAMQYMLGLVPGSRRSPGEGNDFPLQYSCLENFKARGAQQAAVHEIANSQTQLNN